MKKLTIVLSILLSLTLMGKTQKNSDCGKKAEKKHSHTQKQGKFLNSYFVIHAKLVKSELPSSKEIDNLYNELTGKVESCSDENIQGKMKQALDSVKAMKGAKLKDVRENFFKVSKTIIPLVKKHKIEGIQAYYCPMAKKSWLQNQSETTLNPYMPKKMLHCGNKI